ncbi:hypothetical protein SLEP1_g4463 [Rubroshorea leprosula]|uniref:Oligopeptide transporter n=1 Tax=Rubroshorea leprosula TaxID=152421 RepID=A0AAV5HNR4_9ROSI|nr:hypothetical protein SLEP1_g4463 [Rubroshorea leprosula]
MEPLLVSTMIVQLVSLRIGNFLAKVLPSTKLRIRNSRWEVSLNPGPFNAKEHVLISIFAQTGTAFVGGTAYGVGIVNVIQLFYHNKITFSTSWMLVISTQLLGYGLAGIMRKFVVEPAHMRWPNSLVQVPFFRALHEKDNGRMPRRKFFYIALICSCAWHVFPGYLFEIMASISWVYWAFPKSVTAHQIGSGIDGLGLGSFSLDLSTVFSSLGSPLITPFFTTVNILVGHVLALYVIIPIAYYVLNTYHAQRSPIVSLGTFNSRGKDYDVSSIVNDKLEINLHSYEQKGPINFSISFTFAYGISMAAAISILTHVAFFNGKEILGLFRASFKENKVDIHTKLMRKYKDIPNWWFYLILGVSLLLTLHLCIFQKDQIQLPWWSAVFAIGLAFAFTLPMSIITATTNQTPTLDVITQYIMGMMLPGRPIANLCFKTYGAISTTNASHFLNNFKMCHYMKIPPRSRFLVEVGTS